LCKKVFNVHTAPPSVPPDCLPGRTEHQVVQRPDDTEETVRERLRVYEEKTRKPVSGFYSYTGLIRTVDADGDIDVVTQRLFDTLNAGTSRKPAKSAGTKRRAAKRRAPAKPKARARRVVRKAKRKSAKQAAPKRRTAAKKRKVVRKAARPARARRKSKR
jgi:adenylate kinase